MSREILGSSLSNGIAFFREGRISWKIAELLSFHRRKIFTMTALILSLSLTVDVKASLNQISEAERGEGMRICSALKIHDQRS